MGGGRDQARGGARGGGAANPVSGAPPTRPRVWGMSRRARGPGDQATGKSPRAGARNRLRRGRPGRAAGRTRAGPEIVRGMTDDPAVLPERRDRVLVITINR